MLKNMTSTVLKWLNKVYSYCVIGISKVKDFVLDFFSFIILFFKNLLNLWRMITKGFQFSRFFQGIGLYFGAVVLASRTSYAQVRDMSEARYEQRRHNVLLGLSNTWTECAMYNLSYQIEM